MSDRFEMFGKRFLAAIIDAIVIRTMMVPVDLILNQFLGDGSGGENESWSMLLSIYFLQITITVVLYGYFYKSKGATPGKTLMKIKVVDFVTGKNIGYLKTFVREIIGKPISAILLIIGFLMPLFRKDQRALHDLLAKTQVQEA